ncbi:thioredoxin-dependent thiol peroxidase [Ichthyobacterium seriolicida]|uniref:thioredoxin-dependent peroxiredoxin n=1 Tax=Ichthyobacterium seriolicida TaxID=242600 RepID=A0A1J1E027_9FLAO|nr:thioredoxin-dependent thiol peroxidase [Ichthyobacterium seriolicida]BAV94285.1 thiol peroxidase, Bcp-type [Ichthyobacterium seriolicida]
MTHLKKGDVAPHFTSKDQDGQTVSLSDFKGKKLVLFFYPRANTPGCTAEACNLRDNYSKLEENNYQVLGVSCDTQSKQLSFKEKKELPYSLLSDTDQKVVEAYGVFGEKKFMGKSYNGIFRTTFIIDENGIIEEVITDVKTKDHTNQILK